MREENPTVGIVNISHDGGKVLPGEMRRRSPRADQEGGHRAIVGESHEPAAAANYPQQQVARGTHNSNSNTGARVLSGEEVLEGFLNKYPRPTPGSGVGVGPIKSTTQGYDNKGQPHAPDYQSKRAARMREKRRHLRELQEWEFQTTTTPPRRANSAAVGLHSFGQTFILFGLHYTGHFKLDVVLPSMAICFGGGMQLIAGLLAWVQGFTFAYVSFVCFGGFFLALTCVWMLPNAAFKPTEMVQEPSEYITGVFYSVWGVLSFFLFICSPRTNLCIVLKELTTTLCLLCLAGGLMRGNDSATHAGGYFGIIAGAVALYLCFASLINEVWDSDIIPVFPMADLLEGKPIFWSKTRKQESEESKSEKGTKENPADTTLAENLNVLPAT